MSSVIFLVDIDAFFAQAEQVRNPALRGKPVIVGGPSAERSVVAAASYEARALGIKTAMPTSQAHRICPQAIFLPGDFNLYQTLSRQMHEVCLSHTPLVEMVSADECFMDVTGCRRRYLRMLGPDFGPPAGDIWPLAAACRLQREIKDRTGLNVSIGVAANRHIAKIASDLSKPAGILHVRQGYEAAFLAPLPLKHMPGIGKKTAERLQRFNLRTIGQLAQYGEQLLSGEGRSTANVDADLCRAARGFGNCHVSPDETLPKSISRETTFSCNVTDAARLRAMLAYLLQHTAGQMRGQGLLASTVTVKLRYGDFQTVSRSRTIRRPTDHDDELFQVARQLLAAVWSRRTAVRLIGVCLSKFSQGERQLQLYDAQQYDRRSRLYQGLDQVRQRYGFASILAGQAVDLLKE